MRFSSNLIDLKAQKVSNRESSIGIGIEAIKIESSLKDLEVYQVLCMKFGKEYYGMINRIFGMYAIYKQDFLVLTCRQFIIFLKDFFPNLHIFNNESEILYKKVVKAQDFCDIKAFVELLYDVHKIRKSQLNKENDGSKEEKNLAIDKEKTIKTNKDQAFKKFLDQDLLPNYKSLCNKIKEPGFERIQIFFEQYEKHENLIVELFLGQDNLLKNIFSLYEILDIRVSKQSFIDLKGFLKLCGDYSIIPVLSNLHQITKIFMTYKKYGSNIIDFAGFVILICCIAHL